MSPTLHKSKMEGNAMQLDDEWKSYVFNSGQRQSVSSRPAGIYNNRGQSVERNPVSKTNKLKKKMNGSPPSSHGSQDRGVGQETAALALPWWKVDH